ncbi:TPA: Bro-N domain-containing protein [Staphylococcus aureus]|nr:Bro-N domain-containing protein [Staphylococcus aureus]HCQ3493707.1 Bro-N domain-containing protein [Staphylococcus aureus]
MQELQTFNFEELPVRTLEVDGEPYFIGKDVADILGYTNSRKALSDHVDEEDKLTSRIVTSGQNRNVTIINESGLYSLTFSSKLENAKRFKRWVTSEVLPTLRKTGAYQVPQTPMQALEMMFKAQKDQEQFNKQMQQEITGIRHIVGIETKNWRNDTNKMLSAIAQHLGGGAMHQKVKSEAYKALEEKGRCNLKIRMQNRKGKMLANGATKTQINKLSKLDVITDEPRLVEIYISVIKSMAIKYGVDISQFEI